MNKKLVYLVCLLLQIILVKCNEKHEASIKNLTEVAKTKPKPNYDDPVKKDLRKYMRECGVSIPSDSNDDDKGGAKTSEERSAEEVIVSKGQQSKGGATNGHWAYEQKRGGKGGTYPSHYGKRKGGRRGGSEEDSEEDEDEDDYRGSSNRRKGGNNRKHSNRKGNKKGRPSDDYEDSREDCDESGMKKGGYGSGGRKGFNGNSEQYGGMGWSTRGGSGGGSRYNTKSYGGYSGYYGSDPYGQKTEYGVIYSSPDIWASKGFSSYGGRLMATSGLRRAKRQIDEEQCISQCVFGYLEMLDDNRVPSETEVIRYFQNRVFNTAERMRWIKLARKCFAMLSTTENTDGENGCQFSRNLAKCLQLDIKEEA